MVLGGPSSPGYRRKGERRGIGGAALHTSLWQQEGQISDCWHNSDITAVPSQPMHKHKHLVGNDGWY
ncbi:hypothetical protein EYF80_006995 [Liparis tanakae]|uniref:Uncharacterized protein n=1 Tax=Liparis tanakae TaxID=230148 RepID=A0A4Z2IYX9_9TELE|nr:hypothetical protein EYF80_006995 [Liparis tanakae]